MINKILTRTRVTDTEGTETMIEVNQHDLGRTMTWGGERAESGKPHSAKSRRWFIVLKGKRVKREGMREPSKR